MGIATYSRSLMEYDQVWRYLIELRKKQDINQYKLAEKLNISRNGWQNIERGKTKDPGTSVLLDAIRVLNASFDDVKALAGRTATAQDALSRAERRFEEIAAHDLSARPDSTSAEDLRAQLREIEEEFAQVGLVFPRLAELLGRLRQR